MTLNPSPLPVPVIDPLSLGGPASIVPAHCGPLLPLSPRTHRLPWGTKAGPIGPADDSAGHVWALVAGRVRAARQLPDLEGRSFCGPRRNCPSGESGNLGPGPDCPCLPPVPASLPRFLCTGAVEWCCTVGAADGFGCLVSPPLSPSHPPCLPPASGHVCRPCRGRVGAAPDPPPAGPAFPRLAAAPHPGDGAPSLDNPLQRTVFPLEDSLRAGAPAIALLCRMDPSSPLGAATRGAGQCELLPSRSLHP